MGNWGSGRVRGLGARFIGGKEREGELGCSSLGENGAGGGAQLGEDGDSARGSAMATAWRAGARGEVGSCQGRPGSSKPGAPAPAYGSGRRHGSGKREVEEAVSASFVIFSKFKNPVM